MTVAATIQMMVDRIVQLFEPLCVILFGSRARGTAIAESDVDMLVVCSQVADKHRVIMEIRHCLGDPPVSEDIIVTTPEEISRRANLTGSVLGSALCEGGVHDDQP
ncbi:MAG: nucleotidyltransferase domain-containing protein [Acidobacteria bacterium]|nr:nucleotidyltransferase domain-containing protein [Acidobacteriota bacterium]